jgi:hypothetical protein
MYYDVDDDGNVDNDDDDDDDEDYEEEEEEDDDVEGDDAEEEDRSQDWEAHFVQSTCTRTFHKSHFASKFTGQVPYANPRASILCEPARFEMHMDRSQQAFCTEIFRENAERVSRDTHFVRACAVERAFCALIYRENPGRDRYHLD